MEIHRKKALVVYESISGNTRSVAEAIAEGLAPWFETEVLEVSWADARPEVDLVVVGGPTHAWGMSRERTRRNARRRAAARAQEPVSAFHGVREWLRGLEPNPGSVAAAAFDTGRKSRLPIASAARGEVRELRRKGYAVLDAPAHFRVDRRDGMLVVGELELAKSWGRRLAELCFAQDAWVYEAPRVRRLAAG